MCFQSLKHGSVSFCLYFLDLFLNMYSRKLGAKTVLLSPEQIAAKFPWINLENVVVGSYGNINCLIVLFSSFIGRVGRGQQCSIQGDVKFKGKYLLDSSFQFC